MSAPVNVGDGTDLLAQEIREELGKLVSHPIGELQRLEHVAADGESATTPLLVVTGTALLVATLFAVVLGLTLLVVYLTT